MSNIRTRVIRTHSVLKATGVIILQTFHFRSVRNVKGWLFYKDLTAEDRATFKDKFGGEALYTCPDCDDMSPITARCLNLHHNIVHK